MEEALKAAIKSVALKATQATDSTEALKFTQAALNAANALMTVSLIAK